MNSAEAAMDWGRFAAENPECIICFLVLVLVAIFWPRSIGRKGRD